VTCECIAKEESDFSTYAGTAEVEHASALALLDVLALLDRNLTGTDFVHTNADETHKADIWIIRLDENDGAIYRGRSVL